MRPVKPIFWLGVLIILGTLGFMACRKAEQHAPKERTLTVSIPAQKWILDSIAGPRFKVFSLLDAGSNPETFEPTMKQLMDLQNSEAYFTVGNLPFETASLPKIRENFPALTFYDTSRGIVPITGTHAAHAHTDDGHDHSLTGDPHIWTSLRNARVMAKNMYETLLRIDPAGRELYTTRYQDLDRNLAALDDSVAQVLTPLKGRSFLVWHPSLSYMARDYGLNQLSVENEGKEAGPAQYQAQIQMARRANPLLFFTQREFDARQAESMARELGLPTQAIAVMDADIPAQIRTATHALTRNAK